MTSLLAFRATGDDEMCNFYIMYYRDANEPDVSDAACDDQLARQSESIRFPSDSDTPLTKPKHKMKTNIHKVPTYTKPMRVPTDPNPDKMTSTVQKTSTHNTKPLTTKPRHKSVMHPHKVYKKPLPSSMHHKGSSSKEGYDIVKGWPKLGEEHLGQVSGVALDSKGNVIVFHRGNRVWDYK